MGLKGYDFLKISLIVINPIHWCLDHDLDLRASLSSVKFNLEAP